jgi:hypothetical protein
MSTRIRYLKNDHLLVTSTFLGKEDILKVEIDTTTMSYKIIKVIQDRPERVVQHGAAKTLAEVKKHVKATLKGLGVQFHEEVRNKASDSLVSDNTENSNS